MLEVIEKVLASLIILALLGLLIILAFPVAPPETEQKVAVETPSPAISEPAARVESEDEETEPATARQPEQTSPTTPAPPAASQPASADPQLQEAAKTAREAADNARKAAESSELAAQRAEDAAREAEQAVKTSEAASRTSEKSASDSRDAAKTSGTAAEASRAAAERAEQAKQAAEKAREATQQAKQNASARDPRNKIAPKPARQDSAQNRQSRRRAEDRQIRQTAYRDEREFHYRRSVHRHYDSYGNYYLHDDEACENCCGFDPEVEADIVYEDIHGRCDHLPYWARSRAGCSGY